MLCYYHPLIEVCKDIDTISKTILFLIDIEVLITLIMRRCLSSKFINVQPKRHEFIRHCYYYLPRKYNRLCIYMHESGEIEPNLTTTGRTLK